LDLDSPTTKQAYLRLGFKRTELVAPKKTFVDNTATSTERKIAKLQNQNAKKQFMKAVKAVKNERNHILALK
jgi:hypothetical protein